MHSYTREAYLKLVENVKRIIPGKKDTNTPVKFY